MNFIAKNDKNAVADIQAMRCAMLFINVTQRPLQNANKNENNYSRCNSHFQYDSNIFTRRTIQQIHRKTWQKKLIRVYSDASFDVFIVNFFYLAFTTISQYIGWWSGTTFFVLQTINTETIFVTMPKKSASISIDKNMHQCQQTLSRDFPSTAQRTMSI